MTMDELIDQTIENNKIGVIAGADISEYIIECNNRFEEISEVFKNSIIPVKVMSDGDGHKYIIPNHRQEEFEINLTDTDFIDSGRFDEKWSQFSTGGCINNKQLYTIITDI